ncbi:MAG: formylglycine-generating enzyme family protein [Betaproteobacteria bacterium]|nr:formylglycine-generating enzyme family protein [Betaproteobacteria bacterium]
MMTALARRLFPLFVALFVPLTAAGQQPLASVAGAAPGTVFSDCPGCPEMVVIPPGTFTMGSPDSEQGRDADEGPQRQVTIARAFAAGRFEVTRGQFSAFAAETGYASKGGNCWYWNEQEGKAMNDDPRRDWRNPGFAQGDDHPAVCVSWDDAKAYAAWMARRTGKSYRLLTEAEWEYAARAGSGAPRPWGFDPDDACRHANVGDQSFTRGVSPGPGKQWTPGALHQCDDGYAYTAPVGRFRVNALGLHDMLGNVWEWVEDCWNDNYVGAPSDGSAWFGGDCGRRVDRGGGWGSFPRDVRSAARGWLTPGGRDVSLGFRLARTD